VNVPQLDLGPQYQSIKTDIDAAIARVLDSGHFIMGPEVAAFEQEVAEFCNVTHAIGVASGTDALLLSLRAIGVEPGDMVLLPSFTFFATAGTVHNLGAVPVFIDINPITYNIDPAALETLLKESPNLQAKAKAVIPVHLYGQMADMDPILEIAKRYNLEVIEDAAQAIGTSAAGKQAGTLGKTGCFSFFPSKNLGAFGDGGMIISSDDALAERLRRLRVHGSKPKYYHQLAGYNSRLDALQAAILRVKLKHLNDWSAGRQAKAKRYDDLLAAIPEIKTPVVAAANTHIYHQYTIRVLNGQRDALAQHLKDQGIGTSIYYPMPLHLQECFSHLGYCEGDLPHTEQTCTEVLSLPIFPELEEAQIQTVVQSIVDFF